MLVLMKRGEQNADLVQEGLWSSVGTGAEAPSESAKARGSRWRRSQIWTSATASSVVLWEPSKHRREGEWGRAATSSLYSVDGSMWWWLLLVTLATAKRAPSTQESVIEEVTAKQLERVLTEKDYVAVFWCKYHQPPRWRDHCVLSAALRFGLPVHKVLSVVAQPTGILTCHIPIWLAVVPCSIPPRFRRFWIATATCFRSASRPSITSITASIVPLHPAVVSLVGHSTPQKNPVSSRPRNSAVKINIRPFQHGDLAPA